MHRLVLHACTCTPLGAYLKALGIFRLVSEQSDPSARGSWSGDTFVLESTLNENGLAHFLLNEYEPTPLLAPWNGGSGFYSGDNQEGISAISGSVLPRFAAYRDAISTCRSLPEVQQGNSGDEKERRTAILRQCRNLLSDRAVEWLDAAVGIAADGSRSFAPVLGTGGNEGRLDYTNNFMARLAGLLISPDPKLPIRELLQNALFGNRTTALQPGPAGQYDPGRAGGANQGPKIKDEPPTNPWNLVLTLEGAVAWASGLYRRQGTSYRSVLCSPFTVQSRSVGYGSATAGEESRAEIWTPMWSRPAGFVELKTLLRESRASVKGHPAHNALELAEAATSLGVDRGIGHFIRYSFLKRRGDSYVALPTGAFAVGYKSEADLVREFQSFLDSLYSRDLPKSVAELRRDIDSAIYQVLLLGGRDRMRSLIAALGRMLRRIATTTETPLLRSRMHAAQWLDQCGYHVPEVRIAGALASIYDRQVGSIQNNLSRADKGFAWSGGDLSDRMISVLSRRLQMIDKTGGTCNPLGARAAIHPGDATLFIEGSVDDSLIEDLLFAFAILDWSDFEAPKSPYNRTEVLPVYAVLKHLFLPAVIRFGPEPATLRADPRILSLLASGDVPGAAEIAVHRLRIANLRPLEVSYSAGPDARRLAAGLLIPAWSGKALSAGFFHEPEEILEAHA